MKDRARFGSHQQAKSCRVSRDSRGPVLKVRQSFNLRVTALKIPSLFQQRKGRTKTMLFKHYWLKQSTLQVETESRLLKQQVLNHVETRGLVAQPSWPSFLFKGRACKTLSKPVSRSRRVLRALWATTYWFSDWNDLEVSPSSEQAVESRVELVVAV